MADYESTMPKLNVGPGSATQRAALQRLRDLKKMKVFDNRVMEKADLFQQRQQKDINLFLAGKSLKYCKLKSVSSQTGDDDQEVGVMTDDIWTEEKEMQFPTLTERATAGELLPFLRRVLPLFEASMAEFTHRQAARGTAAAVAGTSEAREARRQAIFGLPESFTSTYIGASTSVTDVSICPQWYGADHALVLFTWEETQRPTPSDGGSLAAFTRPLRSLAGLYPILSSALGADEGGASLRPVRCLYSFCRLNSIAVMGCRPHIVVAGSEMGSLTLWDLRTKPHWPCGVKAESQDAVPLSDPDLAHFEGKNGESPWLASVFSTDIFAVSASLSTKAALEEEEDFSAGNRRGAADAGTGVHAVEISCVRCSDVVGGDSLVFALDLMGVVSFWRIMELASVTHQHIKLALQGSLCLAEGVHVLGGFLGASYLCIHPQQQAQFVVCSTSGLHQANRKRSSSLADGPNTLELLHHLDEDELDPWRSAVQPCSAAFSPFFPGLLLAAYSEGDLALFDCTICVPITHWGGALSGDKGKAAPVQPISVAWSTRRPCVFFVKSGGTLDVWDLAERNYAAVLSVDLCAGPATTVIKCECASCADLYVTPCGRPVVGHDGTAMVFGLPPALTVPLQEPPHQHSSTDTPVDELLVPGYEDVQTFPTLARHRREVQVPEACVPERDLLRVILAGAQPLQAWV